MRSLVKATMMILLVIVGGASCGSSGGGSGYGGFGSGSSGASSGGPNGTSGGGGASNGDAGSPLSLSGSDAGGVQACSSPGTTQSCCSSQGTETCLTGGELPHWGPCLDTKGAVVASCTPPHTCGPNEQGNGCDAGVEAGPPPPPPAVCTDPTVSNEPEILVGYSPGMGQTVGVTGQIKVWVCDENSPFIAPGEQVDNATGAVVTPGNRTATASDGLLYEPALYIAPQSPTNGGMPHFPQWIKGSYNNNPPTRGTFTGGAPIDTPPAGTPTSGGGSGGWGGGGSCNYNAEFVWDVRTLGLGPGTYTAVFSVHDGDHDRAIGCVTIVITR